MNLSLFNTVSLFKAATNLFQQLGLKLNTNTAEPLPVNDLLKQYYKDDTTFKTTSETYFIGIIDNIAQGEAQTTALSMSLQTRPKRKIVFGKSPSLLGE